MNIETLISEAKARQEARTREHMENLKARAEQAGETLRNQFMAAFGPDMLSLLDAYVSNPIDDVARITFRYQERNFSLRRRYSDGVCDWVLVWLAPRDNSIDERRLPYVTISETRRDSMANLDTFVLALSELAETEDYAVHTPLRETTEPAPRVMNEYEAQLLDALRQYLQSEI